MSGIEEELQKYTPVNQWESQGSGRFADVFRAQIRATGEYVAIKKMKYKITGEACVKFKNEFEILWRASQGDNVPNIVRVVSCFVVNNDGYIVMQPLCEGGTLESRIESEPFDDTGASRVIFEVLKALAYLHARDIVHRDVKPQNIMYLDNDDESPVYLCDFGLSKIVNEGMTATRVGTRGYQAPEILQGHMYTANCDVWSVGVVAYLMISGDMPFPKELSEAEVLARMKERQFEFNSDFSDNARDFISRCLQLAAERPSAAQLLSHPWFHGYM